jgi:hypothetical protein
MVHAVKERLRTIAAVIALVASGPTLTIAVGNLSGYLSDEWAIYALILMSVFGLPASAYLVTSYWRERKARNFTVIDEASSGSFTPVANDRTKLRLMSST